MAGALLVQEFTNRPDLARDVRLARRRPREAQKPRGHPGGPYLLCQLKSNSLLACLIRFDSIGLPLLEEQPTFLN